MRVRALFLGMALIVLIFNLCLRKTPTDQPTAVVSTAQELAASAEPDVNEIAVEFKPDVSDTRVHALAEGWHLDLRPNSPVCEESRLYVARVPRDQMDAVLTRCKQDPEVESAEPNIYMAGLWDPKEIVPLDHLVVSARSNTPNDPLYKYQWDMQKIDVEKAWTVTQGKGVVVAVIDTGVAYEDYERFHEVEDLKGTRFVQGYNFVAGNVHANDDHAHGTHVAGTIAQTTNNGIGCVGVAPLAAIMPIKVLSARGSGKISDIADGIRFSADKGAKVINMSLGGPVPSGILESAVKYAAKKGVVIVCAAGNSNSESVSYPARYPQCIAVSATRYDDQLTFYSNRGKRIDVAAPGGDMNVDQNNDGYRDGVLQNTIGIMDPTTETYALFQGTSMAAPHVAGAAALLISMGVTRPEAVRARLRDTARKDGFDLEKGYGGGVLDVGKATVKTAVFDPMARLVIGLLMLVALIKVSPVKPQLSAPLLLGLLMGSAGLFFLPWLGVNPPLVATAMPDWDLGLAGVNTHANALFWSALIPFGLAVCTFGERRLQGFCLGLSLGFAAFLLHQFGAPTADIQGVPGMLLSRAWLLGNVAACGFLAYVLGFNPARANEDLREKARGQSSESKGYASSTR